MFKVQGPHDSDVGTATRVQVQLYNHRHKNTFAMIGCVQSGNGLGIHYSTGNEPWTLLLIGCWVVKNLREFLPTYPRPRARSLKKTRIDDNFGCCAWAERATKIETVRQPVLMLQMDILLWPCKGNHRRWMTTCLDVHAIWYGRPNSSLKSRHVSLYLLQMQVFHCTRMTMFHCELKSY